MFRLEFVLLSSDPYRLSKISHVIDLLEKELEGICNPIKAGASILCAPSKDALILVYTSLSEAKQLNVYIRVESHDAQVLSKLVDALNKRLRQEGYVITLSTTFSSFS